MAAMPPSAPGPTASGTTRATYLSMAKKAEQGAQPSPRKTHRHRHLLVEVLVITKLLLPLRIIHNVVVAAAVTKNHHLRVVGTSSSSRSITSNSMEQRGKGERKKKNKCTS
ncbi:hypothetical protein PG990_010866 [Apiospora arundinis]